MKIKKKLLKMIKIKKIKKSLVCLIFIFIFITPVLYTTFSLLFSIIIGVGSVRDTPQPIQNHSHHFTIIKGDEK